MGEEGRERKQERRALVENYTDVGGGGRGDDSRGDLKQFNFKQFSPSAGTCPPLK